MTIQRRISMLLVTLLLAGCGARSTAGVGESSPPQPSYGMATTDFTHFLDEIRGGRYEDYAGRPGTRVRDEAQFEMMRLYLLDRYGHLTVTTSYHLGDAIVDCVPKYGASPEPPPLAAPPAGSAERSPGDVPQGAPCPAGTIPVYRTTLADLVRYPDLAIFLGKDPGGGGLPPAPSPSNS